MVTMGFCYCDIPPPKITKGPVGKTSPSCVFRLPGQVTWAVPPLFLLLFARPGHLGRVPAVIIICGPELVAWAKFSQF